jgi:hypothetical protein
MQYPPINWKPYAWEVRNGQPVKADHVLEVDREATWLACHKTTTTLTANYFESGSTYEYTAFIPQFTAHVALRFLCSGYGHIVANSGDDTYNSKILVNSAGPGTTGTHSLDDAVWVSSGGPIDSVSANNLHRALDVDFLKRPAPVDLDWTITDNSASQTLRVYAVQVAPIWPDESADLTTAA